VDLVIAIDDPQAEDVQALVATHLAFSHAVTPVGHVHALEIEGLGDPAVTFYSARRDGLLVGIGALKERDASYGELKSMHTVESVRGQGIGRAMLDHLLAVAADRNYDRVMLETGTMDSYAPARSLYARAGFVGCEPFGAYTDNPYSTCMTITLLPDAGTTGR
jgi:putative acetyltransferase